MKETHVILRTLRADTRDAFLGEEYESVFPEPLSASLSVEIEDVERQSIPTITRNREVVAIAPVVPMRLIDPLDSHMAAQPVHDGIAWGVRAVGAEVCPFSGAGVVVAILDT